MTESLVATLRTPISAPDLYACMRNAWESLMSGEPCKRESLLTMLAQSALETGFWHACWNNNLGNVKHVSGDGHDYYQIRCNEIEGGKIVWYDPPNPACSFVAYPNLDTAVRCYLVALRGRFRTAWPAVLAGDAAEFCHLLKIAGYYTASESLYTTGVLRCYHQLDGSIPIDGAIGAQAATDEAVGEGVAQDAEPLPPPDAA